MCLIKNSNLTYEPRIHSPTSMDLTALLRTTNKIDWTMMVPYLLIIIFCKINLNIYRINNNIRNPNYCYNNQELLLIKCKQVHKVCPEILSNLLTQINESYSNTRVRLWILPMSIIMIVSNLQRSWMTIMIAQDPTLGQVRQPWMINQRSIIPKVKPVTLL